MPTPLVARTVYLPEALARRLDEECSAAMLRVFAEWSTGDASGGSEEDFLLSAAEVASIKDVWSLPRWGVGDEARADWVVRKLGRNTRAIVSSFVRHAGPDGVSGKVVAEEAGYSRGAAGVAPALGHIAGATKKVGRRPMWHYDPGQGGTAGSYRMDNDVAALFGAALARVAAVQADNENAR